MTQAAHRDAGAYSARLDPEARAYLDRIRSLGEPPVDQQTVEQARRTAEATASELFGPKDSLASVLDSAIPGTAGNLAIRIYIPASASGAGDGILLYFHGGGWVFGSYATHDGVCRAVARRANAVVISVNYRLAPEYKFPAAADDAWASTRWVFGHTAELGMPHTRVAVGGDSAGGNLAAVVALRARDAGLPLRLQLLVYPVTDCRLDSPSYSSYGEGYGLTLAEMRWFVHHYLSKDADREDPRASPLLAEDVRGVAPAVIITAECDPLRSDGESYAARLAAAGVPVSLMRYDGLIHGFWRMPAVFRQAEQAFDAAAADLRAAFGHPEGANGAEGVAQSDGASPLQD